MSLFGLGKNKSKKGASPSPTAAKSASLKEKQLGRTASQGKLTSPAAAVAPTSATVLSSKDPSRWSVQEVGAWLAYMNLDEYRATFEENHISGEELLQLREEDLTAMQVRRLGDRKKILRKLKEMQPSSSSSDSRSQTTNETSEDDDRSSEGGSSDTSDATLPPEFQVKCTFKGEKRILEVEGMGSFQEFRKFLEKEFGTEVQMRYEDEDHDMISISSDKAMRRALKGKTMLKLELLPSETVSEAEATTLNTMADALVITNTTGEILFFNKAAEKMFGHTAKETVGKNVTMLMGKQHAKAHAKYLQDYLRNGVSKIIGVGRVVPARKADGTKFLTRIAISETKTATRHTFTAVLHEIENKVTEKESVSLQNSFQLLETLVDACIVINATGAIQFFNSAAEQIFGYTRAEVLGANVSMLMPYPFKVEHDAYIKSHISSGISKVLGTGREVPAQMKDGSIITVRLKVSRQDVLGVPFFTGTLQRVADADKRQVKSLLEQEREVMEGLLLPAIIINPRGLIQAFNQAACKFFGYTLVDVVGQNVNMLMTGVDKEQHDAYLKAYLETGKARIIGRGRKVVARLQDGRATTCTLWVTEKHDAAARFFVGVLQPEEEKR